MTVDTAAYAIIAALALLCGIALEYGRHTAVRWGLAAIVVLAVLMFASYQVQP